MPESEPRTLELRDYLRVVRRRKWTVVLALLVCVPAAIALSFRETPVYVASAKLLVAPQLVEQMFSPTAEPSSTSGQALQQRVATEIEVMDSPDVRSAVTEDLGRSPGTVWFKAVADTSIVAVNASDTDAERAGETANAYADTYLEVRRERAIDELLEAGSQIQVEIDKLSEPIADLDAQLAASPPEAASGRDVDPRVRERGRLDGQRVAYIQQLDRLQTGAAVIQQSGGEVIAEAGIPTSPVNKTPVRNGAAGLALGLILGVALAFLREYLDDSVKSKEDVERSSGLTVVGLIPALPEWKDRKDTPLVTMSQPRSHAAEAYGTLRTSVEFLALEHPIHTVQVTSALAQEGKTTTLANLATSFARAGQRVIVVCCDLRRPRIHEFFGLSNDVGFTSVLLGEAELSEAIRRVPGDLPLGLVASGPLPPNPAELLSSGRAAGLIERLEERCDLLLIDSPPVIPVTDGLVISRLVDAVLLVTDSGSTTKRGLARAVELLRQIDAPIIGSVLNGVRSGAEYGYGAGKDSYSYYGAYERDERRAPVTNGRRRAPRKRARVSS